MKSEIVQGERYPYKQELGARGRYGGAPLTLTAKEPSIAMKADQIELPKSVTVGEAVAVIFAACLKHWTDNEAAALKGLDPEGVHEMRVALRRMRAAISDFQKIIPVNQVAWMKRETRWLLTSLGPARDWDVFLSELLASVEVARPGDTGLANLRIAAEAEREKGYVAERRAIRSQRYSALMARMRRWSSAEFWRRRSRERRRLLEESAGKLSARLLTKRHNAVLKLGRGFKNLSADERHQLRIALKKLRYTAEFFPSLYHKKREQAYFHALAQLQNSLGRMNDIVVAGHLLERLSAVGDDQKVSGPLSTAVGILIGWHTHSASSSECDAEENWREFCHCDTFW